MQALDQFEEDDAGTVFRDVITLALCGFVAVVILLLPHIRPEAKQADTVGVAAPGNVMVEARWPDELDADVDLWVEAPGDVPVGYSNKSGVIFNLLRDDLGRNADPTKLNYEASYSRGIPPGEYAVNLHLYRNKAMVFPVPVTVVVSAKRPDGDNARQLLATTVQLDREGQELTVFRFKLTESGELVGDSVHSLYKPLRSGRKS
ncbi:hypothetical protein GAY33_01035 [Azospirillum brasilense]|uniref:hypothetical protein n=1 Tax=Azospirillum argentinense TaxID=2970906 RepID=UPI00190CA322|nr:hypothetical protein [Azospirillum argentinense]MBK3797838.1 hypothetical protein [Azospirillum argentinense]